MDPHIHEKPLLAGKTLAEANYACILLHGRGAGAHDMLHFAHILDAPEWAFICPHATDSVWFWEGLEVGLEQQGVHGDASLRVIEQMIALCGENAIPPENIVLGGFSQGACLSVEYALRKQPNLAGLLVLSGCVLGSLQRETDAKLDMPIIVSGSTHDTFIADERISTTKTLLENTGGRVQGIRYDRPGHTITPEEIHAIEALLEQAKG